MATNSRNFMKHVESIYWKSSLTKEWADRAKESYEKISRRASGEYAPNKVRLL